MKYFITGGAGFIGSTLSEKLLQDGIKIVSIDNFCNFYDPKLKENNIADITENDNYKIYKGDIRDRKILERIFNENKFDCVIHLAAMAGVRPSIENPCLYQEVNCFGTQNII